jgi:hypothetical protein
MTGIIIALLILWLALALIGFVIKTLLWLGIAAAVLFVATLVVGIIKAL